MLMSIAALIFGSLDAAEWTYRCPPGETGTTVRNRVLLFEPSRPADLEELVDYAGTDQKYAQLRFGSPGSIRVAVVLDTHENGAELYVDADRDRIVTEHDLVPGTTGEGRRKWSVAIDALGLDESGGLRQSCTVRFATGRSGRALHYATDGFLEGEVSIAGQKDAARRADGDGNGRFADPQDRLWLDLDGDGRFDRVDEQFLFSSFLRLDEVRYAVRSDPFGRFLRFEPVVGEGRVCCRVNLADPKATIQRFTLSFVAEDGSAFRVAEHDAPSLLPVGRYHVGMLALSLRDGHGRSCEFVFSSKDQGGPAQHFEITDGDELVFDPLGSLRFDPGIGPRAVCKPGENLLVRPLLTTSTGLLINTSSLPGARVELRTPDGVLVDSSSSGFA